MICFIVDLISCLNACDSIAILLLSSNAPNSIVQNNPSSISNTLNFRQLPNFFGHFVHFSPYISITFYVSSPRNRTHFLSQHFSMASLIKIAIIFSLVTIFLMPSSEGRKLLLNMKKMNVPLSEHDSGKYYYKMATNYGRLNAVHIAQAERYLQSVPSPGIGHHV